MTSFGRMLHYLRSYWILISLAVSNLLLATVVELLIPLQIERIIDDDRIVERGDHEELLALKGFYHNLYMSQFRGQMLANFES